MRITSFVQSWSLLVWSSLFCSTLLSAAELVVPEQFDLVRVNGEEEKTYFQRIKKVPLQLGKNTIELEFNQIYDAEFGDSHDRIRSKPFTVVVEVSTEQEVWTLLADLPKTRREAVVYAKRPIYTLQNQLGERHTVTLTPQRPLPLLSQIPPAPTEKPSITTPPPVDVLQMLNYWWQLATPEQKQAFLDSIGDK